MLSFFPTPPDETGSLFDPIEHLNIANGNPADDTLKTYSAALKQFLTWCKIKAISPMCATEGTICSYRQYLLKTKKYKPASVALKLTVVRRFYTMATKQGFIAANPATDVKPPTQSYDPATHNNYLDLTEAKQLIESLPNDDSLPSLRDRALIEIMVWQGCRTVELYRLNVGDIIKRNEDLGLNVQGKRSRRIVPLTPDLAQLLQKYLKARKKAGEILKADTPLFTSLTRNKGSRLTRRSIARIVDKYLKINGWKNNNLDEHQVDHDDFDDLFICSPRKLSAHSLRHTCGTLALWAGVSLRQVQDLLGHRDPETTALYAHAGDRWRYNPALAIRNAMGV
ncbi:tyrosine-type recombinase/integrase [Gloeothece verrucosa]|uniref:Integrase family protein n=1 Tax=Gloeothece verrucosa (strain PCC 7822) TaxID=497965 RepID=E0ULG2_GLOV7|nr:tyrosine-type recombinase/integrase [Gloeothece verrucosa]ADN17792.1 integrase family protein [Gloeothece verrucosa PCC 7822]